MAELYTIKAQTLTDAADSIRRYTSSQNPYILNMAVDGGNGVIIPGSVTIHYREYIDAPINSYDGMIAPDGCDVVVAYDYLRNKNTGLVVPVLYKTQSESEYEDIPDTEQPMYYEGKAVVDGVAYNKWRLIDDKEFLWDGTAKKYIYTNVIVCRGQAHNKLCVAMLTGGYCRLGGMSPKGDRIPPALRATSL